MRKPVVDGNSYRDELDKIAPAEAAGMQRRRNSRNFSTGVLAELSREGLDWAAA